MARLSEITQRCTACGACLEECPTKAIVRGMQQFAIDLDFCDGHGQCVSVCPENAIVAASPKLKGAEIAAKK